MLYMYMSLYRIFLASLCAIDDRHKLLDRRLEASEVLIRDWYRKCNANNDIHQGRKPDQTTTHAPDLVVDTNCVADRNRMESTVSDDSPLRASWSFTSKIVGNSSSACDSARLFDMDFVLETGPGTPFGMCTLAELWGYPFSLWADFLASALVSEKTEELGTWGCREFNMRFESSLREGISYFRMTPDENPMRTVALSKNKPHAYECVPSSKFTPSPRSSTKKVVF